MNKTSTHLSKIQSKASLSSDCKNPCNKVHSFLINRSSFIISDFRHFNFTIFLESRQIIINSQYFPWKHLIRWKCKQSPQVFVVDSTRFCWILLRIICQIIYQTPQNCSLIQSFIHFARYLGKRWQRSFS